MTQIKKCTPSPNIMVNRGVVIARFVQIETGGVDEIRCDCYL